MQRIQPPSKGVTSGRRPAMMVGTGKDETRTPIAWRQKGTGLRGDSSMREHAWPRTHGNTSFGNPEAPSRLASHHFNHGPYRQAHGWGWGR